MPKSATRTEEPEQQNGLSNGPAGVFRRITEGDNNYGGVKGYSAGPGWNPVTGWGSPDGMRLIAPLKAYYARQPRSN